MQTTKSTDGTTIGYETHGAGEPLVLVHGSTATRDAWDPHVPHLEEAAELHAVDRRGRGSSGDADDYALEREVEDVQSVLAATGANRLFGHSFGGLCALEAARETDLDELVLYEPAVPAVDPQTARAADRMAEYLESGDREGAMRFAFDVMLEIDDVETLPHWPEVIALAEATQREFAAVETYELPGALDCGADTLVLTGEHSPPSLRKAARRVHERLRDGTLVEIEGVGHAGIEDPAAVAEPVLEFLAE
ncbi:alpha/beta hydrolase [Salinarchaeum chitinilyticum]